MDNLLEKLKIYMKAKGLTIYKLTELSDLSENTIELNSGNISGPDVPIIVGPVLPPIIHPTV